METYRNFAVADARRRRGKDCFTSESFYDLAERLKGRSNAYAMFLSYGEDFAAFVEGNEYSCRDWDGSADAWFADFPVDFDAKDNLELAFEQTRDFVQRELIDRGIDTRYFVIYLSGGKGFHVHISSAVLDTPQPVANAGYRLKATVAEWMKSYKIIDMSVYTSISLFRLPGSKHKSGLHKTEIPWEKFTWEHVLRKEEWAAVPQAEIRIPEQTPPPVTIALNQYVPAPPRQYSYNAEADFDPEARITPHCQWLQDVLADPSNGGNDGKGREKRRNAIGILLSAHEISEQNEELKWYVDQLEKHEYMSKDKMDDVFKWVREYDKDGQIKCAKTCYAVGCPSAQRKRCGTKSPLDWKLKKKGLNTVSIAKARQLNRETMEAILEIDDNGVYVLPWPVGIGKTHTFIEKVKERELTAFCVSPTHQLALQTHLNFEAQGIASRHIASRNYLADNAGFQCEMPEEVELAMRNGYGSHSVCARCPKMRKSRKTSEDNVAEQLPDDGHEPCEYWDQFEDLGEVTVAVGVHQHLFEFIYKSAGVAQRSVTMIDEGPLEALGRTILPIEPAFLEAIRGALKAEIEACGASASQDAPRTGGGIFGAAAAILEADMAKARSREAERRSKILSAFLAIFEGEMFDVELITGMQDDALRANWYETANAVVDRLGLNAEDSLPHDHRYLAVPYPVPAAVTLAALNQVYDPAGTAYLPAELPPSKVIILDATASNDVYGPVVARLSAVDQRPYRYVEHPLVEQPYSHVTQVTSSSYGVSAMYDEETRGDMLAVIRMLMEKHPGKSLVVCHKQHALYWQSAFAGKPEVSVATYGSLKGLNQWTDCVAQYIVGTPFVHDHGIRDLCAKLGDDIPIAELADSAALKRVMLLAKNGDTTVVNRRVYEGKPFHTAVAQMKSQWEVTQAVRLRLYDQTLTEPQQLFIFSNVELRGMYADRYATFHELVYELQKEEPVGERKLEVEGVAYEQITDWFRGLPKGTEFTRHSIPEFAKERFISEWLMAAMNAGWVERRGAGSARRYVKLVD